MLGYEELQQQIDALNDQIANPATPEAERWELIKKMQRLFELRDRPVLGPVSAVSAPVEPFGANAEPDGESENEAEPDSEGTDDDGETNSPI